MITKTLLEETILPAITGGPVQVSYMTWKRTVYAHLVTPGTMRRGEFETALEARGCKVNRSFGAYDSLHVEITNIEVP